MLLENPLDPVKGSSADAHAPSAGNKGMRGTRNVLSYRCPEVLDLLLRNRRPHSFAANKTKNSWYPQNLQSLLRPLHYPNAGVATYQWYFHTGSSFPPLPRLPHQRNKC